LLLPLAARLPSRSSASNGVDPSLLFRSFIGTMRTSDFSSTVTLGLRHSAFPSPPEGCSPSGNDEISQFLCEGFPRMLRVSDRVEPSGGFGKRRTSPTSTMKVAAQMSRPPRKACKRSTTGVGGQSSKLSSIAFCQTCERILDCCRRLKLIVLDLSVLCFSWKTLNPLVRYCRPAKAAGRR